VTDADAAPNCIELRCGRDAAAVSGVLDRLEAILAQAGCPPASRASFLVVAEEMVTNVARYAWPVGVEPGAFIVAAAIRRADDGIEVRLSTEDDGVAFDPTAGVAPDTDALLEDRPIGGLGIHLVRTMTICQAYRREGGRNRFAVWWRCAAPPA
jgi:anti-sigma regulatory factor (Ser/Thr protein kinase)